MDTRPIRGRGRFAVGIAAAATLVGAALLSPPLAAQEAFPHDSHDHLFPLCQGCHDVRSSPSPALYPSPEQCEACHDGEQASRVAWSPPDPVAAYDHPSHEAAAGVTLACTDCHGRDAGLDTGSMPTSCDRCHDDHHGASARCRACHTQSPRAQHEVAAHQGCGGAGCHDAATTESLAFTRELCLTCHREMVEHKPGRSCGTCHAVGVERGPATGAASGTSAW